MAPAYESCDTLVIGAGLIGSSVAWHLAEMGGGRVLVVDPDLEGSLSSSELNAGGVRATWNQPINILCGKVSIEYFQSVQEEVGYRPCGYLWMRTKQSFEAALKAREKQVQMGWPVEVWSPTDLQRRIPFIDKVDDLAGAFFSPRDGLVNPNRLKVHYREKAKAHGAIFLDGVWVQGAHYGEGVRVSTVQWSPAKKTAEERVRLFSLQANPAEYGTGLEIQANRVVNCAGPWAANVAQALGYTSPARAVRRQICLFDSRDVDLSPYGMMIDPSGVYFHPEGPYGLAGFANRAEPEGHCFEYQGEEFFQEQIWPALYERSTRLERLRHVSGWAGLYEVSPDETAIVGCVQNGEARGYGGVFEAHSFSGHGVMHSYAVGKGLAERMIHGSYRNLDLSSLEGSRFERGDLLQEKLVI